MLLFVEIRCFGASTVSSHPVAWVCVTGGQKQTGCDVNADLCLVPERHSLLIGVCACITDNYLCACIKIYSVSQITFEATISWLGTLVNSTHQSTELRFLKFEVSGTEHQISQHSPAGRSKKLKAMEAVSL